MENGQDPLNLSYLDPCTSKSRDWITSESKKYRRSDKYKATLNPHMYMYAEWPMYYAHSQF